MAFFRSADSGGFFMYEIIWHGRGGQGVVVASQLLAEAAFLQGYRGVTSAPTFGPERRGAPLTASTRISEEPIRTFSQIERADIAVVLDPSLLGIVDIGASLKKEGLLLVNTPLAAREVPLSGCRVVTADAAAVALRHRLVKEGAPLVNTPMLGVLARAAGIVACEYLERVLALKMRGPAAEANIAALKAAYEEAEAAN